MRVRPGLGPHTDGGIVLDRSGVSLSSEYRTYEASAAHAKTLPYSMLP